MEVSNILSKANVNTIILENSNISKSVEREQSQEIIDVEKVRQIVETLNEFLKPTHTSVKYNLHEQLNDYYVTVIDSETNAVIKEIPSRKILDIYASMIERMGLVVDEKI
ncbi:flagellar protein FlaG [Salirhabdus salicampi]|uniref:flagellar protein FlaG n=1 Tax=Salirhabdus salicampi TaxID=476102 RepID=UPI0020C2797E|nr:flagellar protein FlaG [Salirhabdus salicampi]MCP8617606.1 flagellar protein FlaG [Salirhabdus salicampi]